MCTCTVMAAARCANRSVLMASSIFSFSHRTVTTMAHLQFPPKESCRAAESHNPTCGVRGAQNKIRKSIHMWPIL